jgi:hypothetical protein
MAVSISANGGVAQSGLSWRQLKKALELAAKASAKSRPSENRPESNGIENGKSMSGEIIQTAQWLGNKAAVARRQRNVANMAAMAKIK